MSVSQAHVFGPGSPPLRGSIRVPGDKSLSHRAVLFAAMAVGTSHLSGVLDSEDVRATIGAVAALGAVVDLAAADDGSLHGTVTGWGESGPTQPVDPIDCGNSGTTCRLLLGMLAGWPIEVVLTGDASLSRRPMKRVTVPLTAMGASFDCTPDGTLPITVRGSSALQPTTYASPVASAQVKTALVLAALRARGASAISEPALSRDHTERLLPAFGVELDAQSAECRVALRGPQVLRAATVAVPGDPSSAAFLVCAALLVEGSTVEMPHVSLNPTRTGFLRVLGRMGARIEVVPHTDLGAEPVGSIIASHTPSLRGTTVIASEVPSLVDEVPVLALVAACATGTTRFEGVAELRVKESDRLQAIVEGLASLGVSTRTGDDWLEIDGPARLSGATLDSLGDHRLAMTWALAGLVSAGPVTVTGFAATAVSWPLFAEALQALQA